mgnify:CR=1 FL=1
MRRVEPRRDANGAGAREPIRDPAQRSGFRRPDAAMRDPGTAPGPPTADADGTIRGSVASMHEQGP